MWTKIKMGLHLIFRTFTSEILIKIIHIRTIINNWDNKTKRVTLSRLAVKIWTRQERVRVRPFLFQWVINTIWSSSISLYSIWQTKDIILLTRYIHIRMYMRRVIFVNQLMKIRNIDGHNESSWIFSWPCAFTSLSLKSVRSSTFLPEKINWVWGTVFNYREL